MKRFVAAIIDANLLEAASIIVYCIVISIMRLGRNLTMEYMGSYPKLLVVIVYILVLALVHFAYFFFCEWKRNGQSIGKGIVKIKMEEQEAVPIWKKAAIAGLKVIACFLYPITIGYYLCFDKMPYDKLRKWEEVR